ncbi:hypothetical protein [Roseibium sp. RKSG952]|uniref:hypothetical protein n=1 Tax=Roseibium sp. RKSG952 TaxID=2529384 RepID=UPI0012BC8A85|nr:hypothetical protein [Roseibium sp. RKSG952]MTH96627.1 hypothetical protein [Roseibium sp. RKSG952]
MKFLKLASVFSVVFTLAGVSTATAKKCYENREVESVCEVQVLISDHASAFASKGGEQSGNSAHFGSDVSLEQRLVDESFYVTAQRPCMVTKAVRVSCPRSSSGGDRGGNGGRQVDRDGDGVSDNDSANPGRRM